MRKEQRDRKPGWLSGLQKFGIAVAVGILVGLIVSEGFVIKKVEIEGNQFYDPEIIQSAILNDEFSWNTLLVYLKYRIQETEEIPFIDTMEVSVKSPGTLHVKVYEKGMMGYFYIPAINQNAYFDKDGFVVETSPDIIHGIPKIEGIACSEVILYEKMPVDESRLKEILTLTQTLKRSEMIPDKIVYGDINEPIVTYGSVQVKIGSTKDLTQKVERISKILPSLEGMSGTLHLENWTEETTNIVFDKDK